MTARYTRKTVPAELALWENWSPIDVSTLSDEARQRVGAMTVAIQDYLAFRPVKSHLSAMKQSFEQLLRAFNRCVALAPNGRPYGWCGLLRYFRIKEYVRTKPLRASEGASRAGLSGALHAFWRAHADIHDDFDRYLLTRRLKGAAPESHLTPSIAHAAFLTLCEDANLHRAQWPFTAAHQGRTAIAVYFRQFIDRNYERCVGWRYGKDASAKSKVGTGYVSRVSATLPFDIVELDEHRCHVTGAVGIQTPKGVRYINLKRLSIILAVDRSTHYIFAYDVIFHEANADDVLRVMHRASSPWQPRTFFLSSLTYPTGFRVPDSVNGLAQCGCTQLLVDNALSHLAGDVRDRLQRRLGCAINFGAVARFERRPIVECIFHLLETFGIMRVISTTGSTPADPRRNEPERAAVRHKVREEELRDLIELLVVDHNIKSGMANFLASPLGQLAQVIEDDALAFLPPCLPPLPEHTPDLDVWIENGVVAGSRERGERPHIVLGNVAHTNPFLARRWDLLGRKVCKHVHTADVRSFTAFLDDGSSLGVVVARQKWAATPHSLATRKAIHDALASGEFRVPRGHDPVRCWLDARTREALARAGTAKHPRTTHAASEVAKAAYEAGVVPQVLNDAEIDPPIAPPTTKDALQGRDRVAVARAQALN